MFSEATYDYAGRWEPTIGPPLATTHRRSEQSVNSRTSTALLRDAYAELISFRDVMYAILKKRFSSDGLHVYSTRRNLTVPEMVRED